MWTCEKVLRRINNNIIKPFESKGLNKDFRKRLDNEFCNLWELYRDLYGTRFDFLYQAFLPVIRILTCGSIA